MKKNQQKAYENITRQFVHSKLYKSIQFITCSDEIQFGSTVQQIVCNHIGLKNNDMKNFWIKSGQSIVEKTLKHKRQSITQNMQKTFKGTSQSQSQNDQEEPIPPKGTYNYISQPTSCLLPNKG